MSDFTLATTSDGSFSLHESKLDELYHNRAGAFTEAMVTYVQPASQYFQERLTNGGSLRVLDSCFGLGYNSLALANHNQANERISAKVNLNIDAIEIDSSVLELVPQVVKQPCLRDLCALFESKAVNLADFNGGMIELPEIRFKVYVCDLRHFLQEAQCENAGYDIVFHDPFSPKKVPELWTIELFQHYHRLMADGGVILTYSTASAVRGALLELGFKVFRTTALGGKVGGTMAIKSSLDEVNIGHGDCILPLSNDELKRLATSSRVPYRDEKLNAPKEQILLRREVEQKALLNNSGAQQIFQVD